MKDKNEEEEKKVLGRPAVFTTKEELEAKIHEYFNGGCKKRTIIVGAGEFKKTVEIPIPTLTGLAYFLGFASRQSLYDYENDASFSYTIKRARLYIEIEYEEQLQVGNVAGAIFALKNFGWKDKTEVINTNMNSKELTDDEIVELNKKLENDY